MKGVVIKKSLVRKIRKKSTPFKESPIRLSTGIRYVDIEDYISSDREVVYAHGTAEIYVHKIYPNILYVRKRSTYPAPAYFLIQWDWLIFKLSKGVYVVGAILD